MAECRRCGRDLKDLRAHVKRIHPEEFWWKPDMPPPHQSAVKVTLDDHTWTREGYAVTWHEWDESVPSGAFEMSHGWFIPVELPYRDAEKHRETRAALDATPSPQGDNE